MIFDRVVVIIIGTFFLLIILEHLSNELRSRWKRRVILRRYAHTEKIPFALSEGETIIGVREEHQTLCFYVSNHEKDGKEYEY
jgi:hypothetical protein